MYLYCLNNTKLCLVLESGKSAAIVGLLLFGSSPILKTLTQETSSDTIWVLVVLLFITNCLLHDYSWSLGVKYCKYHLFITLLIMNLLLCRIYSGSVSLNAAIFGSVLLASRLPTTLHVFALMGVSLVWFGLFPSLRRAIRRTSLRICHVLTTSLFLAAVLSLIVFSKVAAALYLLFMLFGTFICPYWFISLQKYKE